MIGRDTLDVGRQEVLDFQFIPEESLFAMECELGGTSSRALYPSLRRTVDQSSLPRDEEDLSGDVFPPRRNANK